MAVVPVLKSADMDDQALPGGTEGAPARAAPSGLRPGQSLFSSPDIGLYLWRRWGGHLCRALRQEARIPEGPRGLWA